MDDVNEIILGLSRADDLNLVAILITGSGKSFSSGLFLDNFNHKVWKKNPITLICEQIENCNCPVICALNGGAYGGAVEIALSCDFRVANEELKLMVPASKLGIHYEPSGLRRALNILGPSITRKLFILGEIIVLEEILKSHFIDYFVTKDESVIERSKQLACSLKNNAPLAVVGMKKTIVELLNNSLNIELVDQRVEGCFKSADHQEALLARKQKRNPLFKGI